jgi:hypothetical protein
MTETLIRDDDYRPCPHGDVTCPCQDAYGGQWDLCHYEGENPMRCPRTGIVGCKVCRKREE